MHRSPVALSVVFFLMSTLSAEAVAQALSSSNPATGKDINTFEIRTYSEQVPDWMKVEKADSKKAHNGLVVDYYPFNDSGFRVSAGTFSAEHSTLMESYAVGINKTYLGVGWKKLLDDAKRLDVSVEFGAFFGEESANEPGAGNGASINDAPTVDELDATIKTARPVMSLGIEYRF